MLAGREEEQVETEEAEAIRQQALSYLNQHNVMTLATYGAEGSWASAVYYVNKEFDLFFLSAASTRHIRNLVENPVAAAAIQEDYSNWKNIQGIQLEGFVEMLSGHHRNSAIDLFSRKFSFLKDAPTSIAQALEQIDWFHLSPDRLYFIDNSKGFGHRDLVDISSRGRNRE